MLQTIILDHLAHNFVLCLLILMEGAGSQRLFFGKCLNIHATSSFYQGNLLSRGSFAYISELFGLGGGT
jgi:hypothetical protein